MDLVIPDKSLSINDDAIAPWRGTGFRRHYMKLINNADEFNFPIHKPYEDLNNEEKEILWIGNEYFIGIEKFFKKIERKNYKIQNRVLLSRYRGKTLCNICNGSRLRREAYYVKIDNKNLPDILKMSISELEVFFKTIKLNKIDSEISNRIAQINNSVNEKSNSIFSGLFNFQISLAFLIAFFNQLSGINFVLYYAPEILQSAGLATSDSLMSSVSIGFVNLVFTMFGLRLIDKYGRRYLMKIGSIGYIISLISIGVCFIFSLNSYVLLTFILIFIASHAIGQGTVIWVFISEIFPNSVRAKGQSLGTATHWIFAALITALTPYVINMLGNNPGMIFYFFGFMMILQLVFVLRMMPETKGISLEEMKFNS